MRLFFFVPLIRGNISFSMEGTFRYSPGLLKMPTIYVPYECLFLEIYGHIVSDNIYTKELCICP